MAVLTVNNPYCASDSEVDLLKRREQVQRLRLQGLGLLDIAEIVGVTPRTVSADIRAICNYWMARCAQNRNVWMAEALSKLDMTETEAWEAFHRSIGIERETMKETTEEGTRRRVTKRQKAGDPRFLAIALKCQQQRSSLLGLMTREQMKDVGLIKVKKPKMLVIKDRQQGQDLIDVSQVVDAKVIDLPSDGAEEDLE